MQSVAATQSVPFHTPIGETLLADAPAQVLFSRQMTALFAGGPTQLTSGHLYLTDRRLAFRPSVSYPHPQILDLQLAKLRDVQPATRRWLGVLPLGTELRLQAEFNARVLSVVVRVADCQAWAQRVNTARQNLTPAPDPSDVLDAALERAARAESAPDRASFVDTLGALSFPQGFWHPEALDELEPLLEDTFEQLGVKRELSRDFLPRLMAELQAALREPVSYEQAEEDTERLDQIERCMRAVNSDLDRVERQPGAASKRFYCFQEDLPGWDTDEPVWLYLSAQQAERLVAAEILAPKA